MTSTRPNKVENCFQSDHNNILSGWVWVHTHWHTIRTHRRVRGGERGVLLSATEKSALVGEKAAAAKPPAAVGKENQALPDPQREMSLCSCRKIAC
jgi:hypothetical protein